MFDKDALELMLESSAIDSASRSLIDRKSSGNLVALPDSYTVHDLEKYLPNRRRVRGMMETSSIEAFAKYVASNVEPGATVFVSSKSMVANAVLNLGTPAEPGHADNRAQIKPDTTAAYAALRQIAQGQALEQAKVAEFLEDWAPHLSCFKEEGEVSLKHAIAAVRNITIEGLRKVEASEQQLSASKSTFEAVTASSKDPLPTTIYFRCEPYRGFESRLFVLRLGIRTSDKPAITLRIINSELHEEQMSQELADKVRAAINDTCPVLIGDYTAK